MRKNKKRKTVCFIGSGEVETLEIPFPCAVMFANANKLTFHLNIDTYQFSPEQIISFKTEKKGMRINHTVENYPSIITFKSFSNTRKIIYKIKQIGFEPHGNLTKIISRKDTPFSKFAFITLILGYGIWIVLAFISISSKSILETRNFFISHADVIGLIICLIAVFMMSIAIQYLPFVQKLFVKRGRYFKEVKHLFSLLIEITLFLLAISIAIFTMQESWYGFALSPQIIILVGSVLFIITPIMRAVYLKIFSIE